MEVKAIDESLRKINRVGTPEWVQIILKLVSDRSNLIVENEDESD